MKLKLAISALLLFPAVAQSAGTASWSNSVTCPLISVPEINHDVTVPMPDGLILPEDAYITSVYYEANYNNWVSPYTQMLVGTGQTTGILPQGVLFGTSSTRFDGDTPENFIFRLRVEQEDVWPPILPDEDISIHPMYPGQCYVLMSYAWDGEDPEPEPTPAERFSRILPAINLLLLGD